ncbi:hypothetical protein KSF_078260 [Reticulibacter mediterranei]|uniref:Uncharacterized protein n=1 Tax=Reticulibacter mediterranei TaxID=2778369 RepID=A0A8J3N6P1_9CHLR|nr:hypothetical protein [Reticulibacter mediterranei]GHO97778.1 hypothetical protein KSF_078260 [Reticulibacter mediterranei]
MPRRNRESSRPQEGESSQREGVRENQNQTRLVQIDGVLFVPHLATEGSSQPGGTPVSDFPRHLELSLRGGGDDKKLSNRLGDIAKTTFKGITEKSIDKKTRKRMDQIQTRLDLLLRKFEDLVTASKSHYDVAEREINDFYASYPCVPLRNKQIKRIKELHDGIASKQFRKEWEEITGRQNKEKKLKDSVLGNYLTERENSLNRWELWVANLEARNDGGWTGLVIWWQNLRAELADARPLEYKQYQQEQQRVQDRLDWQYAQETGGVAVPHGYRYEDYYNAGTLGQGPSTVIPAYVRGSADYPASAEEEVLPDYDDLGDIYGA